MTGAFLAARRTGLTQGSRVAALATCGIAMALVVALAMAAASSTAAAQAEPKMGPSNRALLVFGTGYDEPRGSRPVRRLQRRLRSGALALAATRRARPFPFGSLAHSAHGAHADGSSVLGYATVAQSAPRRTGPELRKQAEAVAAECNRRGLVLLELVRERESADEESLERPGLGYALDRISAGEATGLVVADISRLSRSISELGPVLEWFSRSDARLIAVAQELDTAETDGRRAAQTLIELSRLGAEAAG
jgi:hypothetical protein